MIKNSSLLKINLKNLFANYNYFKKRKKNVIVAPTIKANAYGLGDNKIFKYLIKKNCKHFFVATLEEGINLSKINTNVYIYILNGIQNYNLKLFTKNLIPIINSNYEFERINKTNLNFGIHVDTGINRLGIYYNNINKNIFNNQKIHIVISHLASADETKNDYNYTQKSRFEIIKKKFKKKNIIFSLTNSNGSIISKPFIYDMVRPGIGIYGGNNNNRKLEKNLKSVLTFCGKIIQIKMIKKDEYVGYNQTYKAKKNIKVAIIGAGYADGIPRKLSNKGIVYYKKNKFNIIGRISMDSFSIDISKSKYNLKVGMYIDLINKQYGVEKFANQCDTISNEIITSIGPRVLRIYE